MSSSFELSVEISEQYDFNLHSLNKIEQNPWVKNQWPLVYFIQNETKKIAYVGESTNALNRIKNHLANPKKNSVLNKISIIGSDKFNKSATLDIESRLIQYITSEGTYELQNGNFGLINHNYYQQDLYKNLFVEIWDKLREKKVITKSLSEIENSELFKYSPYKSLNKDQYNSIVEILHALANKSSNQIFIKGSAGTGKTILASYLIKLLSSTTVETDSEEYNDEELLEVIYIKAIQKLYPDLKIGLVIAMSSLRETLQNVFKNTPGLKSSMVLSPSDTFALGEKYDLLIVDEAHRLRKYKNISWMGVFKKNNARLGLGDSGTELDWIIANSKNQIFFYDADQSVKPSDIDENKFDVLLNRKETLTLELKSQMRVQGGNDYITFVDELMHLQRDGNKVYTPTNYDLLVFDSLADLYTEFEKKEKKHGLCRLIAGYAWPWLSKTNKSAIDIEIDGLKFQWNQTDKDWVNSPNAFREIGCIHTTQGYDLNYAGIIFGREISYNKELDCIEVDPKLYFDQNGKKATDIADLKAYILNIYKTILYRGIKGTYIYACDDSLREYLKQHISTFEKESHLRILNIEDVKPYVNAVPLYNIYAAAGHFSETQEVSDFQWVELPPKFAVKNDYFVIRVKGNSMNKYIPDNSWCLFKKDPGGSRNGKIVLVEHRNINDIEFGAGYTVKSYHSNKSANDDGSWQHEKITLKPESNDSIYSSITLMDEELSELKVIGVFVGVL